MNRTPFFIIPLCLLFALTLALTAVTLEAGKPDPNTETGKECKDGIDNDNDGLVDQADPDCGGDTGSGGGGISYKGNLDDQSIRSDGGWCEAYAYQYCDAVSKVFLAGDGSRLRFDSFDAKGGRVLREVTLYLPSSFGIDDGTFSIIDMRINQNRFFPLSDLAVGAGNSCWIGPECGVTYDADGNLTEALDGNGDGVPDTDLCCEHRDPQPSTSEGKVGLFAKIHVDDTDYVIDYGMRQDGQLQTNCNSLPVVVRRTDECTWELEGSTACLRSPYVTSQVQAVGDNAPFILEVTAIDCP